MKSYRDLARKAACIPVIAAPRFGGEGNFPPPSVAGGDYSLVPVRTTTGGTRRNIQVAAEYYPKAQEFAAPNQHTLVAVADLNEDFIYPVSIQNWKRC